MNLRCFSPQQTAEMLPYPTLIKEVAQAAVEYSRSEIVSPERQVLPLPNQAKLLSMPAAAADIAVHKLITHSPLNAQQNQPTIQGIVSVVCALTGQPLLILDGPTVTARRTACVSILGMKTFAPNAARVALYGLGQQASAHLEALSELHPGLVVDVHGRSIEKAERFCSDHDEVKLKLIPRCGDVDDLVEVVISVTTSTTPFYNHPARLGRLLIGAGAFTPQMAEFHPSSLIDSQVFIDDIIGGPTEAGDLIQAQYDWSKVRSLGTALENGFDRSVPVFFKSVGCAAWDLAAGRCAVLTQQMLVNERF